jgi:zinc protease
MATRTSAAIADALVSAAASDAAYTSPAQAWAAAEPVLDSLRADELSAALRHRFTGMPLRFRSAQSEPAGVEALTGQLARAMSRPLPERAPPPAAQAQQSIDLGAPSDVVARTVDVELGTTRVEFANGTRLVVKPTAFAKGRVSVQVLLGQGRSGVPKERCHAIWALDKASLGGTRLRQKLGYVGSLVSAPHTFVLSSSDWSSDTLPVLLKDMTHFVREAAFQGELADQLASAGPALLRQLEVEAGSVYQREMERVMFGNGACLAGTPSAADVSTTQLADLPAVLGPAFAGAVDVVLVGDLTVDDAVAAVRASFATGPMRPRLPRLPMRVQPLPEGAPPHVVTHRGRADQAVLGLFWPMSDFWAEPALGPAGQVAAAVLRGRLYDSLRETLGITYSPVVESGASTEVQGLGFFSVQLETPPDKFETVRQLVQAQLRALADTPVSAEELQSARQPVIEGWQGVQQQNAFWAGVLRSVLAHDRHKGAVLGIADHLQAVTPARIQAYFRDHIARRPPIEVQARGASSTQPAATASAP